MRHHPNQKLSPIQQTRLYRLGLLFVVIAIGILLFLPEVGMMSLLRQRGELERLQEKTVELSLENEALQQEIDKINSDPGHVEEIARRDHKLLQAHEELYDFSKPKKKDND